jgi:hypothetical protein
MIIDGYRLGWWLFKLYLTKWYNDISFILLIVIYKIKDVFKRCKMNEWMNDVVYIYIKLDYGFDFKK